MPVEPQRYVPLPMVTLVKCPIPDCRELTLRDHIVCLTHAVDIWTKVQATKGEPFFTEAIIESVARREQRLAEVEARRAAARKVAGTIYYIRVDDKIKIGWTSNLPQRLMSYPPHMVRLTDHPGTKADERDLHRSFKPSRASGREWYHPTQELMAHIDRVHREEMERREAEHWAAVAQAKADQELVKAKSRELRFGRAS